MRIYLRPITLEDGISIVNWRNSPDVSSHCFDKTPITIESNKAFYKSYIVSGKYKQYIVERIDEDFGVSSYPIATVYLKDFDRVNHHSPNLRCTKCILTSLQKIWMKLLL